MLTIALVLFTCAFIGFLVIVFGMWRWHNRHVMRMPQATDAEVARLFAPRPVVPRPAGWIEKSDKGTLKGVFRRLVNAG